MREDVELGCLYTRRSFEHLLSCYKGHESVGFRERRGDGGIYFELAFRACNEAGPSVKEVPRIRAREDLHAAEEAALCEALVDRSRHLEGQGKQTTALGASVAQRRDGLC